MVVLLSAASGQVCASVNMCFTIQALSFLILAVLLRSQFICKIRALNEGDVIHISAYCRKWQNISAAVHIKLCAFLRKGRLLETL